jgi:Ca2+-binding RTX toxin-like protein
VLGVLFFGAVMAAAGDASALISLSNPFPDHAAATAYIAHDQASNGEWVLWAKNATGECRTQLIGNAGTGLNDNVLVTAGPNGDYIYIVSWPGGWSWCGSTISALNYSGHTLDLNGGAGNDWLIAGTGNTYMYGNGGNDQMENQGGAGLQMSGGSGNDVVIVSGATNNGWYSAGAGNDCLLINTSSTNATMTCGDGSDYWQGPGTRPADCEATGPGDYVCPWIL